MGLLKTVKINFAQNLMQTVVNLLVMSHTKSTIVMKVLPVVKCNIMTDILESFLKI